MKRIGFVFAFMLLIVVPLTVNAQFAYYYGDDWSGTYYNTSNWTGSVVTTSTYPNGFQAKEWFGAPEAGVNPDGWSATYTTTATFTKGYYEFLFEADENAKFFIDGTLIGTISGTSGGRLLMPQEMADGTFTLQIQISDTAGSTKLNFVWYAIQPFPVPGAGAWASPTPIAPVVVPTLEINSFVPVGDIVVMLATADANLAAAPGQITSLLPSGQNAAPMFSYAKWLLSTDISNEMFGPFAPIVQRVSVLLVTIIAFAGVAVILYLATMLIRFVVWIVRFIADLLPG